LGSAVLGQGIGEDGELGAFASPRPASGLPALIDGF